MGGFKISCGENQSNRIGLSFAALLSLLSLSFFPYIRGHVSNSTQIGGVGRAEGGMISYDLGEGVHCSPGKLLPDRMHANSLNELMWQPLLKFTKAHPHFEAHLREVSLCHLSVPHSLLCECRYRMRCAC